MARQTATSRLAPPAWRTILYRHHSRNSWHSLCGRISYLNADPFTKNIKILNRLWAGSFRIGSNSATTRVYGLLRCWSSGDIYILFKSWHKLAIVHVVFSMNCINNQISVVNGIIFKFTTLHDSIGTQIFYKFYIINSLEYYLNLVCFWGIAFQSWSCGVWCYGTLKGSRFFCVSFTVTDYEILKSIF